MTDIHLNPLLEGGGNNETGIMNGSSLIYSSFFMGIAIFILLMAGINFINISIASSLKRAKEVGVRQVPGGSKADIAKHFVTETFLVCVLSFLVAVIGLFLILPFVNELLDKQFSVSNLLSVNLLVGILVTFISLLFLTSTYPAYVLFNLNPVEVLYNKQKSMRLGIFNRALVVVQFGLGVCLLIATLTHLSTNQRVKEIGLRKVLGASVSEIVRLISADFLRLILLSFFISVPVAWYFMREWLSDYAYRIDNTPQIITLACVTALIISFFTICFQAIKAALANPVESLRSE
ncbi:MAG: ABC-type antimicrobial peptide transport system permease subunit [Spirosomataceae bacterium]|jgi:ABC-type antimicrobial peptide transport system permease subunit